MLPVNFKLYGYVNEFISKSLKKIHHSFPVPNATDCGLTRFGSINFAPYIRHRTQQIFIIFACVLSLLNTLSGDNDETK